MSKRFEMVKRYYEKKLWDADRVRMAVKCGWITEAECEEILSGGDASEASASRGKRRGIVSRIARRLGALADSAEDDLQPSRPRPFCFRGAGRSGYNCIPVAYNLRPRSRRGQSRLNE